MSAWVRPFAAVITAVLAMLAAFFCGAYVSAESAAKVYDEAGLLTAEERASLEEKLSGASERYGHDIIVCTVKSLDGRGIETYAERFCRKNGVGINGSGIIYAVAMDDREYTIYAFGTMGGGIMTKSICDSLASNLRPKLTNGDYYGAFNGFADRCVSEIEYTNEHGLRTAPSYAVPIGSVSGLVIGLITVLVMKSGMKTTKAEGAADRYIRQGSFRLSVSRDVFLYSTVRRVRNSSGSSGGRSGSSHHSSGKF